MRRYDKRIRVLPVLLLAGAVSFAFTGVANSAASADLGAAAERTVKDITGLSAYLSLPTGFSPTDSNKDKLSEGGGAETSAPETDLPETTAPETTAPESTAPESTAPETAAPDTEPQITVVPDTPSGSLLVSKNITSKVQDPDEFSAKSGPIKETTYTHSSAEDMLDLKYGQIRNLTELSGNEVLGAAGRAPSFDKQEQTSPRVLIIHTHTTESYELNYSDGCYDAEFSGRTLDPNYSVVGVGAAIAQALADNGIGVIHDGTLFDEPLYDGAYDRSAERITEILKQYPSIEIVLDIHRDGIANGDERIAPVADIDGEKAAQIMLICGADDGRGILPNYIDNLGFAAAVQSKAEQMYPSLTRPLLFDYRIYNQDLGKYNILIEVGAFGNSPEQAKYSGKLVGNALAEVIKDNFSNQ